MIKRIMESVEYAVFIMCIPLIALSRFCDLFESDKNVEDDD